MIKITLTGLFTLFISVTVAQHTKTAELKPIHHQGFKYYYDFKKVDGGAYGLQIPLQSLDDEEINLRYKNFRNLRAVEGVIAFVPLIYLFAGISDQYIDSKTLLIVYGASLAGILVVEVGAKSQLKKGIDRYNQLILKPSGKALGLSLTFKF